MASRYEFNVLPVWISLGLSIHCSKEDIYCISIGTYTCRLYYIIKVTIGKKIIELYKKTPFTMTKYIYDK